MRHMLVFDLSNIAYICAGFESRHKSQEHNPSAQALNPKQVADSLDRFWRQIYRRFEPASVWFACDAKQYWRKQLFLGYKAHRQDSERKQIIKQGIQLFKDKHEERCLEHEYCEADDVIYVLSTLPDVHLTIVSSDSDFMQLLNARVRLFSPRQYRLVKRPKHIKFDLFLKCIRGDRSDNIPSAYPRVLLKTLRAAYANDAKMAQLMQVKLDMDETVGERYLLNQQLIDLTQVPPDLLVQLKLMVHNKLSELKLKERV